MDKQYSTFYLGDALFGVDILLVNEVNRQLDMTVVDQAPPYVRGLLNLRGQIVTVVDLGVRLGLGPRKITPESRIVVLKTSSEIAVRGDMEEIDDDTCQDVVGLLVDRIGDMVDAPEEALEAPPANVGGVDGKYLSAVANLDRGLMVALKLREVLNLENESAGQSAATTDSQ